VCERERERERAREREREWRKRRNLNATNFITIFRRVIVIYKYIKNSGAL
jgi:hypothetical protein